jgi:hypothetical protein
MLEDLPPFLTVEQAAKVLQIGRSKAYELTSSSNAPAVEAAFRSSGSADRSASPGTRFSAFSTQTAASTPLPDPVLRFSRSRPHHS